MIDLDSLIPGQATWRWRDFLFCSQWGVHVYPTPEQHKNLIKLAQIMEIIRNRVGKPLRITSGLRPPRYNELVKGSPTSAHCEGRACDFQPIIPAMLEETRFLLESQLERLDIRMEHPDSTPGWLHIDTRRVLDGHLRIFKP